MKNNELNTSNNQCPVETSYNGSNGYDLAMCVVKYVILALFGGFVAHEALISDKEVHFKHDSETLEFDVKFKSEKEVTEVEADVVDVTEESKEISSDSLPLS